MGGIKLTLPALLEFFVNFNDRSYMAFWLAGFCWLVGWFFGLFFVTSETQAGMNPALDFMPVVFLGQALRKTCLYL